MNIDLFKICAFARRPALGVLRPRAACQCHSPTQGPLAHTVSGESGDPSDSSVPETRRRLGRSTARRPLLARNCIGGVKVTLCCSKYYQYSVGFNSADAVTHDDDVSMTSREQSESESP
jgi:hypothetical protein